MKLNLLLLVLAISVMNLTGQTPPVTNQPTNAAKANKAIEDIIARAKQNAPAAPATSTNRPPAVTKPAPVTLPTPNSRPARPVRQLPPGLQTPAAAATAEPAGTAQPGGVQPPVAGQVAPAPGAPGANTTTSVTAPGLDPDEVMTDDMLNLGGGATMEQLMDIYAELTGRIVLKPASLPPIQTIELNIPKGSLTRREMIQAIDTYLSLNGLTTVKMGEKFVLLVANADAPQQGPPTSDVPYQDLPEASQFTSKVVQLKYIKPTELQPILQAILKTQGSSFIAVDSTQTLLLRDYAINIKRAMELIEQIDVAVPVEYETELIPIKYALAGDIAQVLGGLTTGGSVTSVGSSSASGGFGGGGIGGGGIGGGIGSGIGGAGGMGTGIGNTRGGLNSNRYGTQQNRGISTGVGASSAGRNAFQNRLSQLVNSVGGGNQGEVQVLGETKIIADERTNSLLVFANREDMKTIKDIIAKMDVVLAQVLIESIIMEVSLDNSVDFGVSAAQRQKSLTDNVTGQGAFNNGQFLSSATNVTSAFPEGFSYFANINTSWDLAVQAIAKDSSINVLSRPRIQTSHAVPATIQVGDTVPYVTGTYFGGLSGQGSSQYQQTFVGIQLEVLPLINQEGLVVMDISQNVEQLGTPTRIDGNDVPTTSKRYANAKVAVHDGESIMLGGFISSTRTSSNSGVPILKDIPLLGKLFSSTGNKRKRVELVVLIRPTVLPNPEDAAKMVSDKKDSTPRVKEAEVDFELEDQRLLEKANESIMKKRLGLPDHGR